MQALLGAGILLAIIVILLVVFGIFDEIDDTGKE